MITEHDGLYFFEEFDLLNGFDYLESSGLESLVQLCVECGLINKQLHKKD